MNINRVEFGDKKDDWSNVTVSMEGRIGFEGWDGDPFDIQTFRASASLVNNELQGTELNLFN